MDSNHSIGAAPNFKVDPAKIHIMGYSQGGAMAWRFVCNHSDLIASAAPLSANEGECHTDTQTVTCDFTANPPHPPVDAAHKVHIFYAHGTNDDRVHFECSDRLVDKITKHYGMSNCIAKYGWENFECSENGSCEYTKPFIAVCDGSVDYCGFRQCGVAPFCNKPCGPNNGICQDTVPDTKVDEICNAAGYCGPITNSDPNECIGYIHNDCGPDYLCGYSTCANEWNYDDVDNQHWLWQRFKSRLQGADNVNVLEFVRFNYTRTLGNDLAGFLGGHCVPGGSTETRFGFGCNDPGPNIVQFNWGAEVMAFILAVDSNELEVDPNTRDWLYVPGFRRTDSP
jgi:hypothetical protein